MNDDRYTLWPAAFYGHGTWRSVSTFATAVQFVNRSIFRLYVWDRTLGRVVYRNYTPR